MIRCADALSTDPDGAAAIAEVVERLAAGLDGAPGDLAFLFATMEHADALGRAAEALAGRGLGRVVLGCTAESIVGGGREVEGGPALAAWSAALPGADLEPFHAGADVLDGTDFDAPDAPNLILLGDPFSFPTDRWLRRLESARPGVQAFGGMASGGRSPGENRLVLGGKVVDGGAVGVAIRGGVSIRSVVSQGCRPIGRPFLVTKSEGNVIRELGRVPALEVLREVFRDLPDDDRDRPRERLHVGRVINEYQDSFGRGDFLIRNVMGVDDLGGIAYGDAAKVGQTVQFHVRDAATAHEDLDRLIAGAKARGPAPAGALLFTCNGRGSNLFPGPDHDVSAIRAGLGPIAVSGFFAMGEIGPVGGRNFVHGFTASVVLFGPPETAEDRPGE